MGTRANLVPTSPTVISNDRLRSGYESRPDQNNFYSMARRIKQIGKNGAWGCVFSPHHLLVLAITGLVLMKLPFLEKNSGPVCLRADQFNSKVNHYVMDEFIVPYYTKFSRHVYIAILICAYLATIKFHGFVKSIYFQSL